MRRDLHFAAALRDLDAATFRAFVAALWERRGWQVTEDDRGTLHARRDGEDDRRISTWEGPDGTPVPDDVRSADRLVVPFRLPDPVPDDVAATVYDAAVADADPETAAVGAFDAGAVVDAGDLRERTVYAVDQSATRDMAREFFERDPDDVFRAGATGSLDRDPDGGDPGGESGDPGDGSGSGDPRARDGDLAPGVPGSVAAARELARASGSGTTGSVDGETGSTDPGAEASTGGPESGTATADREPVAATGPESETATANREPVAATGPAGGSALEPHATRLRAALDGPRATAAVGAGIVLVFVAAAVADRALAILVFGWPLDPGAQGPTAVLWDLVLEATSGIGWFLFVGTVVVGAFVAFLDRDGDRPLRDDYLPVAGGIGAGVAAVGLIAYVVAVLLGIEPRSVSSWRVFSVPVHLGTGLLCGLVTLWVGMLAGMLRGGDAGDRGEERRAPAIPATAYAVGLVVVLAVASAAVDLGAILIDVGFDVTSGVPRMGLVVTEWEAIRFPAFTTAVLVGVVAGLAGDRRRRVTMPAAAGVGYAAVVGAALVAAVLSVPTYTGSPVAGSMYLDLADVVVGSVGVALASGVVAWGVALLFALAGGTVPRLPAALRGGGAGRTLAFFCGAWVAGVAGLAGQGALVGAFVPTQVPVSPLEYVRETLPFVAIGLATTLGVVYGLLDRSSPVARVGGTALVGATAGYVVVAELRLLATGLANPGGVETPLLAVLQSLVPGIGVALAAGCGAALTALAARGIAGERAGGEDPT